MSIGPNNGDALARECRLFCRYLANLDASEDIVVAYKRAHTIDALNLDPATPLDRALISLAHAAGGVRLADSFAAIVAPASTLRRKLVILVAILESRSESAARIDRATPGSRVVWFFTTAIAGAGWLVRVLAASVLLVPLRLWHSLRSEK